MMLVPLLLTALQQPLPSLPPARSDTSPFRRLELPTPTLLREGSGRPGPRYWQQRVDYTISVALDTAAHTVAGRETIRYTNNSPDTLRYLWLQLDQNLFREDSRGNVLTPPDARFAARGFQGGFVLDGVKAVVRLGQAVSRTPLATTLNGTVMRVELDRPLPPAGGTVSLEVGFSFQVPEHGADRMGRERFPEGWLYEIAQWYPRMAVYDDVRGWNTEQYLGQGEFYLEYGDIDFAITVPRGFIVAGTGTLQNQHRRPAGPTRPRAALRLDRRDHREGRGGESSLSTRRRECDPHVAFRRQERARRGLGGRPELHLGRERLERDPDAIVLSARRGPAVARVDADGTAFNQTLFRKMVPLSLPHRHQRQRAGGRDGIPDDRVLRQPQQPRRTVRRHHARARAPVVPHDRRQQRAAVRLDG
jgi:hypothetical protein